MSEKKNWSSEYGLELVEFVGKYYGRYFEDDGELCLGKFIRIVSWEQIVGGVVERLEVGVIVRGVIISNLVGV